MADRENPKAYYPGQSYDQSSWIYEKSKRMIESLCSIIDSGCILDDIKDVFYEAINYACLLYTFCSGNRELYDECLKLILKNGSEGLKRFQYIYGLSNIIDEESKHEKDKENEAVVLSLIGPEKINRTLIHEELRKLYYKSDSMRELEDDLYKVTEGEESWDWFVTKHRSN